MAKKKSANPNNVVSSTRLLKAKLDSHEYWILHEDEYKRLWDHLESSKAKLAFNEYWRDYCVPIILRSNSINGQFNAPEDWIRGVINPLLCVCLYVRDPKNHFDAQGKCSFPICQQGEMAIRALVYEAVSTPSYGLHQRASEFGYREQEYISTKLSAFKSILTGLVGDFVIGAYPIRGVRYVAVA